jgi:hypothetical protein
MLALVVQLVAASEKADGAENVRPDFDRPAARTTDQAPELVIERPADLARR